MLIDISADITLAPVYPGDPQPERQQVQSLEKGDFCNLSTLFCCLHNATHIDAPLHFVKDGRSIEQLPLVVFIGPCHVVSVEPGAIDGQTARKLCPDGCKRLLVRGGGKAYFSPEGAKALAETGLLLVGIDAPSVGGGDTQRETHTAFLQKPVALLEGLRLDNAPDGDFLLLSQPLLVGGAEAAPARAVLASPADILGK